MNADTQAKIERWQNLREAAHDIMLELHELELDIMGDIARESNGDVEQVLRTTERYVATLNGKRLWQIAERKS